MDNNQTIRGRNTTFNLGSVTLTPRLQEALRILYPVCAGGTGGSWYIKTMPGGWKAIPDGPFDSVTWNGKKGSWED